MRLPLPTTAPAAGDEAAGSEADAPEDLAPQPVQPALPGGDL